MVEGKSSQAGGYLCRRIEWTDEAAGILRILYYWLRRKQPGENNSENRTMRHIHTVISHHNDGSYKVRSRPYIRCTARQRLEFPTQWRYCTSQYMDVSESRNRILLLAYHYYVTITNVFESSWVRRETAVPSVNRKRKPSYCPEYTVNRTE